MSKTHLRMGLIALGCCVGSLGARPAHAESAVAPPQCRVSIVPMTSPRIIPSNVPALAATDGSSAGLQATLTVKGAYSLEPDPRFPGVTLIIPSAPLTEGAFALETHVACSNGTSKDDLLSGPNVGPAVQLPSIIGTLGATSAPDQYGEVGYPIALTPEAAAHLGTTSFDMSVDGVTFGRQGYGVAARMTKADTLTLSTENGAVYLGSTNVGGKRICAGEVGHEKHAIELRAHVAGASVDPAPLTLDVDVDCTVKQTPPSPYLPDGGGDDRGATGGGGGCSAGGTGDLGRVGVVFAVGALAASVLQRRRRRAR